MTSDFAAPLSARVKATSALGTLVLLGEAALFIGFAARVAPPLAPLFLAIGFALLALFTGVALVAIRGYRLAPGVLYVDRLLWSSTHSLAGLRGAARDPTALSVFTVRGFGNNGFFALNGWRHIAPYGWCRVLATDPANAVVLQAAERTLIVTPDRPDEFAQQALALGQTRGE